MFRFVFLALTVQLIRFPIRFSRPLVVFPWCRSGATRNGFFTRVILLVESISGSHLIERIELE